MPQLAVFPVTTGVICLFSSHVIVRNVNANIPVSSS